MLLRLMVGYAKRSLGAGHNALASKTLLLERITLVALIPQA